MLGMGIGKLSGFDFGFAVVAAGPAVAAESAKPVVRPDGTAGLAAGRGGGTITGGAAGVGVGGNTGGIVETTCVALTGRGGGNRNGAGGAGVTVGVVDTTGAAGRSASPAGGSAGPTSIAGFDTVCAWSAEPVAAKSPAAIRLTAHRLRTIVPSPGECQSLRIIPIASVISASKVNENRQTFPRLTRRPNRHATMTSARPLATILVSLWGPRAR